MIRELLVHLHWSALPVVSMGLFMGVFLGAFLWVFRRGSAEIYQQIGTLPLDGKGDE